MTLNDGWSLVATDFAGSWTALDSAVPRIFGRPGLDVFALTVRKEKQLPAEIADNLAWAEGKRVKAELAELGLTVELVPSIQVEDVRHRTAEVWPTRVARGFGFTEIDGMILTDAPISARENLARARERRGVLIPWRYERGANHRHAQMSLPAREHVRQEVAMVASLETALREAYPQRQFVVSHIPAYAVTFWQPASEYPACDFCDAPKEGKVWCQPCQRRQPYRPHEGPDAEFPRAEWGTCLACGNDVLVRTWEVMRLISPHGVASHD